MKAVNMKNILISDPYSPVVITSSLYNKRKVELHYVANPYEGIAVDVKKLVAALREIYGESVFK
jgi:hypothetical protein